MHRNSHAQNTSHDAFLSCSSSNGRADGYPPRLLVLASVLDQVKQNALVHSPQWYQLRGADDDRSRSLLVRVDGVRMCGASANSSITRESNRKSKTRSTRREAAASCYYDLGHAMSGQHHSVQVCQCQASPGVAARATHWRRTMGSLKPGLVESIFRYRKLFGHGSPARPTLAKTNLVNARPRDQGSAHMMVRFIGQ